jgi:tetratricopeptide (TPR) repeat protein
MGEGGPKGGGRVSGCFAGRAAIPEMDSEVSPLTGLVAGLRYAQMGHLYKQRGNFRRAAVWYRKAVVASPTEADGYIYLGGVLALMGDLDGALKWHEQGARSASGCIEEAHYNAGLVLRAMGRYAEAARAFRRALKIDSAYVEAQRALRDVESALKGESSLPA